MAHVKEPKGVDFIIESEPLNDAARREISEFILNYKKKSARKSSGERAKLQRRLPATKS